MFKLHDLVRELCLEIAKKEKFLYVCDTSTPRTISGKRRVVMSGEVAEVHEQAKTSDAPIRCLIYQGGSLRCTCDFKLLSDFKLLRSVNNVATASTSESIFQQLNLRFLNVNVDYYKCPPVLYLPSSITLIWSLQLLKIGLPHVSTVIAPYEIWEMLQLRFLEVEMISLVDPLPVDRLADQANELVLRYLHTLCNVLNLRLSEEVCTRIPNIRVLALSYWDEASTTYTYYCPHNFGNFHQLEIVKLWLDGNSKWRDFAMSLTFPTSLKVLHLTGSRLNWEELTMMVGSLRNLTSLQLCQHSATGSVWTPGVGNFLCLSNLVIDGCDDLIHWNADDSSFPALKDLRLNGCSSLDEFPSGIGEIPTLEWFQLQCCSESSTISAMRTFVEQVEDLGNENLRLYVTFQGDDEALESFNNKVPEEALTSKNLVLHLQKVTLSS